MRIGILYIALGNYHVFFDDFYHTSEKYFLANVEKYYYVFTDYKEFDSKNILMYVLLSMKIWDGLIIH